MLENIAPVENDFVHYENVDPEKNTEKSFENYLFENLKNLEILTYARTYRPR